MTTHALQDYPALAAFLREQGAASIAVPIDESGTLHAATLLYAHVESPLAFYFVTGRDTQKATLLKTQKAIPCACVIGTVKNVPFTLQMRGVLSEVSMPEKIETLYYQKRGNRHDDINDPKNMALKFTPQWARFTDYSKHFARFFLEL